MATTFEAQWRFSVLEVEGALRAPLDNHLRERVAALLERGEQRIMLSLERLSDIDAAGVGELVHIVNMTRIAGGVVRIAHASRRIRQLLDASGLSSLLVDAVDEHRGV